MTNSTTVSYRTEAQVSALLRELEAKYDLFKYTVDGYSAWRLVRSKVASSLQKVPFQKNAVPSKWFRLKKMLSQSILDLPAFLFPQHARYVVKTFSSALSEKENGFWKDVYFDDLLKEIGHCYKIEGQNSPLFIDRHKAALFPVTITTAMINLLSGFLAKVLHPSGILQIADLLAADLQGEPDLHFLHSGIIAKPLYRFYWSKRVYKYLLMRIRPEFVFVSNTSQYAILAAAKEMGIKTVEFQHGVFTRHHRDAMSNLALSYKSTLIVPDKLFLYGYFWKQELENNAFYEQELCVVGNTRIDQYRKAREYYKSKNHDDMTCHIVLTTQGLAIDQLIDFVAQFLNLVEGQLNFNLNIKLHPSYDRDRSIYEATFGTNHNVRIVLGSEDPSTFDLLSRVDLHLSISSACHYDALGLGVPTVILGLPNHETVLHLADLGHAMLAKTPNELVEIVTKWRSLSVLQEVREFYSQPNALLNIKKELGLS